MCLIIKYVLLVNYFHAKIAIIHGLNKKINYFIVKHVME